MASEFQILLALADEERHGYGIMSEVKARTGGQVILGPGTLYGTIKRMLKQGLLEEVAAERRDPSLGEERRKYYRLTSPGRELAQAEALRLAQLVRDARAKDLIPSEIS